MVTGLLLFLPIQHPILPQIFIPFQTDITHHLHSGLYEVGKQKQNHSYDDGPTEGDFGVGGVPLADHDEKRETALNEQLGDLATCQKSGLASVFL